MEVDELVRVVDLVLRCGASASIPSVTVTPEPPAGCGGDRAARPSHDLAQRQRPSRKPAAAAAGGNDSVIPELM